MPDHTEFVAQRDRLVANPDRRTAEGWRDYTLLLFLYNCGARVSELTGVRWEDLQLAPPRQARLRGKGRKERLVPLWRETANALDRLRSMATSRDHQHVFVNRNGQTLTRDGVAYILHKHASAVARDRPTLARERIPPHVFRHSCAVALLSIAEILKRKGCNAAFLARIELIDRRSEPHAPKPHPPNRRWQD